MNFKETFDRLFPICRSITGNGVRQTLEIIKEIIPLNIYEVPSGTKCFDWDVPKEWNIRDAYISTLDGEKVVDFKKSNLNVLSYSIPIDREISKDELLKNLFYLEDMPEAIPYRTSYYNETWGFCTSFNNFKKNIEPHEKLKVKIDSELKNGFLTMADFVLPGEKEYEILISTYICHPSLANNELSGPLVTAALYEEICKWKDRKYTYRFVFVPETIGAIAYLDKFGKDVSKNIKAGFVVTCAGDEGAFTYKRSRDGSSLTDKIVENTLKYSGEEHSIIDFFPGGSDERQYCSPGFNFPVGCLMKTMYGQYKEYHTSLDNWGLVTEKGLQDSVEMYLKVIQGIELNDYYVNTNPYCEPQLGKRDLYPKVGGENKKNPVDFTVMQYLLNFSDGENDIIDIANKAKIPAYQFSNSLNKLLKHGLLLKKQ